MTNDRISLSSASTFPGSLFSCLAGLRLLTFRGVRRQSSSLRWRQYNRFP